jgi:hypothetical protein
MRACLAVALIAIAIFLTSATAKGLLRGRHGGSAHIITYHGNPVTYHGAVVTR